MSADDLAAVIRALRLAPVDVYGDSYGTFFAQVFTGRHPRLVRSVVLDSAYPPYGESAWYPTQGPAMRRSFQVVCERSPACRRAGDGFLPTLEKVLARVRTKPWRGTAYDADGRKMQVAVNGPGLVDVAFGATFTPVFYRELTAALRSGLAGDRAPLLRLVAEATGGGTDAGPVRAYSEGLDAAVACHDYPQLYDMTAAPEVRQAAVRRRARRALALRPGNVRAVHRARVRRLDLADARLVHPLAGRARRQPGGSAGAAVGRLPRRPRTGAERRARLDHHARRGQTSSPRSSRTPGGCWSATAST